MRKYLLGLAACLLILTGFATSAEASPVPNVKDCNSVLTAADYPDGVKNVTVQEGGSCTLAEGLVVTGGVHAKKGAVNLYVYTAVGHNIQAMGVTGTVHIGPADCGYDPPVGNNVMVKDSHNVLICAVSAGNNIKVTGNDGKITVRDSWAGNNIDVSRNLPYVEDAVPSGHLNPDWIRVIRNKAGNHITAKGNARPVVMRANQQFYPGR